MPDARTITRPSSLEYTESPEANALVASNPVALIIGFLLDQQIKIQLAFLGPLKLRERLGHLDPHRIAAMDEGDLLEIAAAKPPIHRYPNSMAQRIQQCMQFIVDEYDGDADRIWLEATSNADLKKRLQALPGFGKQKAWVVAAVLDRKFGLGLPGWENEIPPYGSLAQVDSLDDLAAYQARKGEFKKAARAAKKA
jgi:uncharacterized HhH-GPD family protein